MAQFILSLDAQQSPADKFVIQVLDDIHIFVRAEAVEMIQRRCQEWIDKITYEKPVKDGIEDQR